MVPSMFVIESPRKEVNLWRKCERMGSLACTARSSRVRMSDRGKHRVVQQDEECDDDEHIDVWRAARNSRIGLASWRSVGCNVAEISSSMSVFRSGKENRERSSIAY